jgi:two-component system, sensor histidine kinase PdtaS
LGLIHRVLYDAHEEIGHNRVDMHWLMGELCRQLRNSFRSQSGVTLDCESTAVTLNVDQAVPVTLFAVEAITNAFQHGFRDGRMGHVHSTFSIAGEEATLSVVDEGSGFSTSAGKRQMGLDLMYSFAEQLSGTLGVNSGEQGTEVVLRFPAKD